MIGSSNGGDYEGRKKRRTTGGDDDDNYDVFVELPHRPPPLPPAKLSSSQVDMAPISKDPTRDKSRSPLDVSSDSVHCNALTQSSTVSYAFSCHTIDTCEKMLSQHRPCPYLIPILAVPAGSVPAGSSDDDNKTASPTPSSSSVPLPAATSAAVCPR